MFKNKYKREMDKIEAPEGALNKIFTPDVPDRKFSAKRILLIATVSILIFSLLFSIAITAMLSNNKSENKQFIESSNDKQNNIELNGIHKAESYDEIKNALKQSHSSSDDIFVDFTIEEMAPGVDTAPDREPILDESVQEDNDFSGTNNQIDDVQESDVVKNDGKFIYYYSHTNNKLYITETSNGIMEQASVIDMNNTAVISMFLLKDTLTVIGYNKNDSKELLPGDYKFYSNETRCDYYDITDKSNPKLRYSTTQDGYYVDSRVIENTVYIVTKHYVYDCEDDIIPECNNIPLTADSIYIPDRINSSSFTIITAFDPKSQNNNFKSAISIVGGASTVYSGKDNLYFTEHIPAKTADSGYVASCNTSIYKVGLNNGDLILSACGTVEGAVKDQFSIDEKNNILRIATNIQFMKIDNGIASFDSESRVNKVYCLNEKLEIIGKSENIGITEQIKSVRYIDDIAYVVTFRQTDPLYAIDLSDPTNPKTLSELKIDGFSSYMHPYGDNYMIGIGYNANPNTGITTGLKITVFDISNANNIFDISSYIINNWEDDNASHNDTEAAYNHKALLIDYKKGIIAIPLTETYAICEKIPNDPYFYEKWTTHTKTSFVFLSFNGKTLTEISRIQISEYVNEYSGNHNTRGLYIGNYGYIVDNEKIISISLETMNIVSTYPFE